MTLFIVNTLADSGAGSLRDAVEQANLLAGADTITFSVAGTIVLGGELALTDDVTIDGDITNDGRADVTISGNNATRIFNQSGATTDVVLQSLTLTNANGFNGGAMLATGGTLQISDSTFSGNTGVYGGGLEIIGAAATISNSLFVNNFGSYVAGGIYLKSGSLALTGTTLAYNFTNGAGGAISMLAGSATITNSTIAKNTANVDGVGPAWVSGGLDNTSGGTFTLKNTVVADNYIGYQSTGGESDVDGIIATATNSVFGTAANITTNVASTTGVGNVGLGVLANNGGTIDTLNIKADSVLINAGTNTGAPATDANGGPRIVAGTVDVGATEFKLVVTTLNDVVANDGQLSLREAVALANAGAGADVITFADGLSGTITLTSSMDLTSDITIDGDTNGDNQADITLSGGNAVGIFYQSGSTTDVQLKSVNLINGNATFASIFGPGGFAGGAIYATGGTLTFEDSTVSGNHAERGGGIYTKSTDLKILSSLLADNSALGGGAIQVSGLGAAKSATVVNSTLTGNASAGFGGGIYMGGAGVLTISNSTITDNRADSDGNGSGRAGAVYVAFDFSTITITNSVVANNFKGVATVFEDIRGRVDVANHSVFGVTDQIVTNTNSLQNVTNLGLGTLALHGGTTQTREIVDATSVLLNAGSNAGAAGLVTDANGNTRIQGGTVDIGATESNLILVTNLNSSGAGSLDDAVDKANARVGVDHIVFQQGLTGTIALQSQLALYDQVSINGDTNGDGDANITLTTAPNLFIPALYVSSGVTASLTSLQFSGIVKTGTSTGSVIQNNGNFTLSYSVISGNTATGNTGTVLQNGSSGSPIVNTGTMVVNQTIFANNAASGGNGGVTVPGFTGRAGGDASASIINAAGATLTTTALALIGGSATGGNGGVGGSAVPPGSFNGFAGGNGGNASIGILNLGTANGTYGNNNEGVAIAGSGGAGGAGAGGGSPGANGSAGQSYFGNLSIGGTGLLNTIPTGNNEANTVSFCDSVVFYGMGGADNITAGYAAQLFGGTGNDILAAKYTSTVRGGLGNDTLRVTRIFGSGSVGTWDGGAGADTLDASFNTSSYGLNLNLSTGANNFNSTVSSIENIIGTNFGGYTDTLVGSNIANTISGLAGIDNISGLGGDDLLSGGAGADAIDGGVGGSDTADYRTSTGSNVSVSLLADTASGGEAAGDTLDNIENLFGSVTLRDVLIGDNGANILKGFGGADSLRGEGGDDYLDGGAGGDALNAGAGTNDWAGYRDNTSADIRVDLTLNTATGGDAAGDTLFFVENLEGSLTRRDILIGNLLVNTLVGNGGSDIIRGEAGNDIIEGGTGADSINAGAGIDTVIYANSSAGVTVNLNVALQTSGGEASGDSLFFFENITGSAFNDSLSGNIFSNRIVGGAGVDTLNGALGSDFLTGGTAADTFRFQDMSFGSDTILDWQDGVDHISVALPLETSFAGLTFTGNGTSQVVVRGFKGTGSAIIVKADAAFTLDVGDFIFL